MSDDSSPMTAQHGGRLGRADAARTPTPDRGADLVRLHEGLYRLPSNPDPQTVFASLAQLLVPAVCDEASADVLLGARLARWQQAPVPDPTGPEALPDARSDDGSFIVHISSLPAEPDGWTSDEDYVVALTCRWYGRQRPGEPTLALIKIVGRYAAAVVHQAQQAELIAAQDIRMRRLEMDGWDNAGRTDHPTHVQNRP